MATTLPPPTNNDFQPSMATVMTGADDGAAPSRDMQILLAAGDYRDSRSFRDSRAHRASKRYSIAMRSRPDSCALAYADDDFVSPNMSDRSSLGSVRMASLITQKVDAPKTVKASFALRSAPTATASSANDIARHGTEPPTPVAKATARASVAMSEYGDPYSGLAVDQSPSYQTQYQEHRASRVKSISGHSQRVSRAGLDSDNSLHSLGDDSYSAASISSKRMQEMLGPKMIHISEAPWASSTIKGAAALPQSQTQGKDKTVETQRLPNRVQSAVKQEASILQGLGIVIPEPAGTWTSSVDSKPQLCVPANSTFRSPSSSDRPQLRTISTADTPSSRRESVVPRPRSSSRASAYSILQPDTQSPSKRHADALKAINSPAKSSLTTVTNIVRTRSPDPSIAIGTASPLMIGEAATSTDSPTFVEVTPLRVRSRLPSGIQSALARTPSTLSARPICESIGALSDEKEDSVHSASSSASSVSGGLSGQASSASTSNTSIEAPPGKPTRSPPPMPEQIMCSNLKLISLDDAQRREKERVAQAAQARAARKKLKAAANSPNSARDVAQADSLPSEGIKKTGVSGNKTTKSKKHAFLKLFKPRDELWAESGESTDWPLERDPHHEGTKSTPRLRVQHASPERRERRKVVPSPAPSLDLRPVSLFFTKMPTEYFAGATLDNMPVRMARSEGAVTPDRIAGLSPSYASPAMPSRSQSPVSPALLYESGNEATGAAAYRAKILDLEQRLAVARSELAVYRSGATPQSDMDSEVMDASTQVCSHCGCSCKNGTSTSVMDRPRVRAVHANMFSSNKDRD